MDQIIIIFFIFWIFYSTFKGLIVELAANVTGNWVVFNLDDLQIQKLGVYLWLSMQVGHSESKEHAHEKTKRGASQRPVRLLSKEVLGSSARDLRVQDCICGRFIVII